MASLLVLSSAYLGQNLRAWYQSTVSMVSQRGGEKHTKTVLTRRHYIHRKMKLAVSRKLQNGAML